MDVGEEYNSLKQRFVFFCALKTHENWQTRVKPHDYVSNPSQWHFTEKRKLLMNQYSHALFCMSVLIERV